MMWSFKVDVNTTLEKDVTASQENRGGQRKHLLDGYRNQRSTVAISKAFEVEATSLDAFHRRSIDLEIKKSKIRSRLETEAKCKEIARRLTLYSMRFDSIKPLVTSKYYLRTGNCTMYDAA